MTDYRRDPVAFIREILGFEPEQWEVVVGQFGIETPL